MESLEEIKQRNKNYYHLSKTLYQTIQGYGYTPFDDLKDKDEVLYSGMSVMLHMKNSSLDLEGPT